MRSTADPVAEALRDVRPAADAIDHDDLRARAERALFGAAEPARVGRYVMLGPIADGGMGVVYGAYDPDLDRKVALKLLHPEQHPTGRARDRLISEARALAKLDHPNVVPVHDVLVVGGQVVIVMELVVGQTVAAWERARPRTWRELVEIYREAGRGLAAAHAMGLVHRDFKPANAIVGDDGRVRVLDLGLAQFTAFDAEAETPATVEQRNAAGLTASGELVGTLGFMSPEQLAGGAATALSDQFSFCVALHRAVQGTPPFDGASVEALLASIRSGRRAYATDGRKVPIWLRALIDRGLAAEPAARYPSMAALLAEMDRERGWRRWRVSGAAAFGVASAAVALIAFLGDHTPQVAACDGGAAEVGAIWGSEARGKLQAHFDTLSVPYAQVVDDIALDALDRYRDAWSGVHKRACESRRRGALSDAIFDRGQACLRRRLDALAATVSVLGTIDNATINEAAAVPAGLPPVDDCEDLDVLLAETDPPATDAARIEVAAVRATLAEVEALERAGRSADALQAVAALVPRAEAAGYAPLLVEALLVEGRVQQSRQAFDLASASLARAEGLALAHGLSSLAVTAAARRIYVEAMSGGDRTVLLERAKVYEWISESLGGDQFARPLLLNNIGVLHMSGEDRKRASVSFRAAHDAAASIDDPHPELLSIDTNLAMVSPDGPHREALARSAWEQLRDRLGERHLNTIGTLLTYGHFVADPARSIALVREACDLYRVAHPDLVVMRAECQIFLAFLTAELGEDATAAYADVAKLVHGRPEPYAQYLGRLASGHAQLQRNPRAARAEFAAALAELPSAKDWWIRKREAQIHLGLGLAAVALGEDRDAAAHLEQATSLFEELGAITEDVEYQQRLAWGHIVLAGVLRRLGGRDERAEQLEQSALAFYGRTNTAMRQARGSTR